MSQTKIDASIFPSEVIHLAQKCWTEEPWERPSFSAVVDVVERQQRLLHSHLFLSAHNTPQKRKMSQVGVE